MRIPLWLLFVCGNLFAFDLNQFLAALQKDWDAKANYQSHFDQTIFAKRLGTRDTTEGMVYVKKPNRLRWESQTDDSVQIINGKKYIYIKPNKRRKTVTVDIYNDFTKQVDTKALNFLSGKGEFRKLYEIKLLSETPKKVELRLIPKDNASEPFVAEIDKQSYLLLALTTDTVDTRSRIAFSGTKTQMKLEDALFEYKSKPTDIVHNQ